MVDENKKCCKKNGCLWYKKYGCDDCEYEFDDEEEEE